MPEIIVPVLTPVVDESSEGHANGVSGERPTAPLGGIIGSGSLETNDGDSSGFSVWNAYRFAASPPGNDQFLYRVPPAGIPASATITAVQVEVTARSIQRPEGLAILWDGTTMTEAEYFDGSPWPPDGDFPQPQTFIGGGLSFPLPFVQLGGALTGTTQPISYYADTYETFPTFGQPLLTADQWNADGNTARFWAYTESGGETVPSGELHVTKVQIRITYTVGRHAAVIPPCHLYPRSAIENTTVYPPASSRQRSNRTNGHH